MNICMVTHDFPPTLGGIASHVHELSKQLVRLNHNVFVVAPAFGRIHERVTHLDGITVYSVPTSEWSHQSRTRNRIELAFYVLRARRKLREIIRVHSIELIHYHNTVLESLITKGFRNTPIVFTAHESYFLYLAEQNRWRLHFYLRHADFLVAPSHELVQTAAKFGKFYKGTAYISNGVDIELFSPSNKKEALRELQLEVKRPTILSARRLEPKNGVEYLIRAMPRVVERVPRVNLFVVGDGSQRSYLENLGAELGLNDSIVWLGAIRNIEMPKYYTVSDVVVLPSLKEATSITGLEGMACGKPLVGTMVGGIPQIIDHAQTGYLVSPRAPEEIAERVSDLLLNSSKARQFGIRAREKVLKEFSWPRVAAKTLEVYKELVS